MERRTIAFRVDGSSMAGMGMGHIERCLSLAKVLKGRTGCESFFIANVYGNVPIIDKIRDAKFSAYEVNNKEEATKLIEELNASVLIIDLPYVEEDHFRNSYDGKRLTVIISDRPEHAQFSYKYCDLFFGLTPLLRKMKREKYHVGEKFIILEQVFRTYNARHRRIKELATEIAVTQGGSDPFNLMTKTVKALEPIKDKIKLTLLVGLATKTEHLQDLEGEVTKNYAPDKYAIKVNVSRSEVAQAMFNADIGIISAGNTLYEGLCVGLPVAALCHHPRQNQVAEFFALSDTIINLGIGNKTTEREILHTTTRLLRDVESRKQMSLSGKRLIDGKGIARVAETIERELLK